jgi:spermidine synthase
MRSDADAMSASERPTRAEAGTPVLREHGDELWLHFEDGAVQSRMLRADPARLELEYTRLMMGFLLFRDAPARIAMIGLGGGSIARYCALRLPDADFTAIEVSSAVIALRDAFQIPPDGQRFRVLCEDGADFVRRDGAPVDVLLVDGFDRSGQPDRLCTAAFYDACRDRLAAGGILAVNLYTDDVAYDGYVDRIRDAFAGNVVAAAADGSANLVVFAGADVPCPPTFRELVERLRALQPSHPVGLDVTVRKILQHGEAHRGRGSRRSAPSVGRARGDRAASVRCRPPSRWPCPAR